MGAEWAGPLLSVIFALLILSVLTSVASLTLRYRRAGQLERQQLKWILLATGVLAVQGIWEIFLPGSADLKAVAGALAFAGIPVSMGIAIPRYRLYDIDRIINRALVYGALTGTIGGAYALLALGSASLGRRHLCTAARPGECLSAPGATAP